MTPRPRRGTFRPSHGEAPMKSLRRYFQSKQIRRVRQKLAALREDMNTALADLMGASVSIESQTIQTLMVVRAIETQQADTDDKVDLLLAKVDALAIAIEAIGNPNVDAITERLEEVRTRLAAATAKVAAQTAPPPPDSPTP